MIVIVDANQVYKLQMTSKRSSLASNTLHGASIAEEAVGVVVDQVKAILVEDRPSMSLSNSKSDSIAETLTTRACRHLNAECTMPLRMSWCYAIHLAEVFKIFHCDLVAEEVEQRILQHASVAVGEHEAISVQPVWVGGIEGHEFVEENVGNWCHTHGRARVA